MTFKNVGGTRSGVILAGGLGERFSSVNGVGKPLGRLSGVPMVLQSVAQMARAGVRHVIILTGANHREMVEKLSRFNHLDLRDLAGGHPVTWELRYSGEDAGTGGRLLSLQKAEIGADCLLSYTDVFSDADLDQLSGQRVMSDAKMSVLAINPRLPWGELALDGDAVHAFQEKPVDRSRWVNGGVFSINGAVLDYIRARGEMLEEAPIKRLILDQALVAMKHDGWWCSVDTVKALRQAQECPIGARHWVQNPSVERAS